MKKIWISLIVAGTLCSAYACGDTASAAPAENKQVVQLCGFDDLNDLWYGLRRDFIGSAKLVSDEKYVSDGENCLKFDIEGPSDNKWFLRSYDIPYLPGFHIFENSAYVPDIEVRDATEFTLDVYNPTDRTMYITFGLDRTPDAYGWYETIYSVVAEVPPMGMTTAHFPVNRTFMTDKWDLVSSYTFSIFDPKAIEKGTEVYVDNFCAVLDPQADQGLTKSFGKNELLSFNDLSDTDWIAPYGTVYTMNGYYHGTANAPEGGNALRYELVGFDGANGMMNIDYGAAENRVGFRVSPKLLEIFDFTQFENVSLELYSRDRKARRYYFEMTDSEGNEYTTYKDVEPCAWTKLTLDGFHGVEGLKISEMRVYTTAYDIFEQSDFYVRNISYRRAK